MVTVLGFWVEGIVPRESSSLAFIRLRRSRWSILYVYQVRSALGLTLQSVGGTTLLRGSEGAYSWPGSDKGGLLSF
jgi:hypothetical protein